MPERPFVIEFYEDASGHKPTLLWIRDELTVRQRRALGYAMHRVLERSGVGVCGTEFGRQPGGGLFEFRLRLTAASDDGPALLRLFCHASAGRVVLVLGGYDKALAPGQKRQAAEIAVARRRLADHLLRSGRA